MEPEKQPAGSWIVIPDVVQDADASRGSRWDNEIKRVSGLTWRDALQIASEDQRINFFFLMRRSGSIYLSGSGEEEAKGMFGPGDAVFFAGRPSPGEAPGMADMFFFVPEKKGERLERLLESRGEALWGE